MRLLPVINVCLFTLLIFSSACRKEKLLTDDSAKLSFSVDTLTFDTIFTTLGSTTKFFRVYNKNNGRLKISEIRLGGGEQSPFTLNIDGIPGNTAKDVEINGKDSLYVFVAVTIDPTNQNNPIIFVDSVLFTTNGNLQKVYLVAWGQDAHFYIREKICTQTWINDKPYVILNSLAVDSGCVLTIEPGCKIYFGGNSSLFVFPTAKIIVNGTKSDSVVFRNIRLEKFYRDKAGQWGGIFLLRNSTGNVFNYAEISNSTYGLQLGNAFDDNPNSFTFTSKAEALVTNCIIRNSLVNGLFGINSELHAQNCLFYNAGDNMVAFGLGGRYIFTHCTFANYGSIYLDHKKPSLLISDYAKFGSTDLSSPLEAYFTNCIVYGSVENEIDTFIINSQSLYRFANCLLKTTRNVTNGVFYSSCIKNEDPQFKDRTKDNYRITENSPCRNAGAPTSITTDLDGNTRDATPDIGCYEFIE
jgi:hypothetical protein